MNGVQGSEGAGWGREMPREGERGKKKGKREKEKKERERGEKREKTEVEGQIRETTKTEEGGCKNAGGGKTKLPGGTRANPRV